jgi:hypothetical protein
MKFVPTPQDYLKHLDVQLWMSNGVKIVDNPEAVRVADELKEKLRKEEV